MPSTSKILNFHNLCTEPSSTSSRAGWEHQPVIVRQIEGSVQLRGVGGVNLSSSFISRLGGWWSDGMTARHVRGPPTGETWQWKMVLIKNSTVKGKPKTKHTDFYILEPCFHESEFMELPHQHLYELQLWNLIIN